MSARVINVNPEDGGLGFVVKKVWVALAAHGDGDEAVPSMLINGQWFPLIAANPARLSQIKEMARMIATEGGKRIVIAEFSMRTDVETIEP